MHALIRTARTTGLLYLGLAITGLVGFLLIRSQLFAAGDPGTTLANLVEHESLARAGVAFELLIVVTQALAAVWFYRLFRTADSLAAGGIAVFGLVNAVAILVSAALLATAVQVALVPVGDAAATVQLLYLVSGDMWGVGGLSFGLWLIPMGQCVLRSGWMPRALGWILVVGGVGYVLSTFVKYLAPGVPVVADVLVVPATIGEFWMIGYLLVRGVRRQALHDAPSTARTPARTSPSS
ncbi:DUF4386 domain-containing protein [Lentzea sp. NPDC051213]|uniref:DUF4386 domain-containing protein n=1 Tax=Lentzea sp. NPDC051213 TaxID=3364126 RepID=UPI0037B3FE84